MITELAKPAVFASQMNESERLAKRHWLITLVGFALLAIYFLASFIQFDLFRVAQKWNPDRASLFVLDTYAHKDHVSMKWDEPEKVTIAFEGGRNYKYDPAPDWYLAHQGEEGGTIFFENGGEISIFSDRVTMRNWPELTGELVMRRGDDRTPYVEGYQDQLEALPPWVRVTANKIEIRPSLFERLQVYKSKVEIHRYSVGWKFFLFDFHSPLRDVGFGELIGLIFSGDRIDPEFSNLSLAVHEFLDNEHWQHGIVLFAMLETILMALIGTMLASLVGLPLGFLAAKNVAPLQAIRFALRRFFDFLRGIDVLIWSLIFLRAFGPGLFTGIFAIAFTDTGTLGKLMSEAIENSDSKQVEGTESVGARRIQRYRFGIVPQILPVFISQSLYYLESNTRSAVIIGAMGAGGIGLHFLGALQTGNDFENVAYIAALVLATVILMDMMSARLRRALIGTDNVH